MALPKDVLVLTTSSVEGAKVKKYYKPVSAHLVAGTNLFNDFLGSLTDVFGGRSGTYQKQLNSLYNEAVEKIKIAAFELGANCVLGLKVDLDEISGKNKSMFMLTGIGTAVLLEIERPEAKAVSSQLNDFNAVGLEKVNMLKEKKEIVTKAKDGTLTLDENVWQFITRNQVQELFPFLTKVFQTNYSLQYPDFYERFIEYVDALPEEAQIELFYNCIGAETNERILAKLLEVLKKQLLFDYTRCMELLRSEDFQMRKRGVFLATVDKPYYNKGDITELQILRDYLKGSFGERGTRATKRQLLSSKLREIWVCECGKTNDMGVHCGGCEQDINGFKMSEIKPTTAIESLEQRVALLIECMG